MSRLCNWPRNCGPDIVVMDITMPRVDGFEATRALRSDQPDVKVIALSMHNDSIFVDGMRTAGAAGYVLKDAAFEDLLEARAGRLRRRDLSTARSASVWRRFPPWPAPGRRPPPPTRPRSPRVSPCSSRSRSHPG